MEALAGGDLSNGQSWGAGPLDQRPSRLWPLPLIGILGLGWKVVDGMKGEESREMGKAVGCWNEKNSSPSSTGNDPHVYACRDDLLQRRRILGAACY